MPDTFTRHELRELRAARTHAQTIIEAIDLATSRGRSADTACIDLSVAVAFSDQLGLSLRRRVMALRTRVSASRAEGS